MYFLIEFVDCLVSFNCHIFLNQVKLLDVHIHLLQYLSNVCEYLIYLHVSIQTYIDKKVFSMTIEFETYKKPFNHISKFKYVCLNDANLSN